MANVLSEQKRQQVIALGRLGWPLRRIETTVGVRRETASAYLKPAGIAIAPRRWGHGAKPAKEVSTDSVPVRTPHATAAPGSLEGPAPSPPPGRAPTASACEPYRELIEQGLARGRNAMAIYQDLVSDHGFSAKYASVRRFVCRLRTTQPPTAHAVIEQARAAVFARGGIPHHRPFAVDMPSIHC
jgi:hypothetical protein